MAADDTCRIPAGTLEGAHSSELPEIGAAEADLEASFGTPGTSGRSTPDVRAVGPDGGRELAVGDLVFRQGELATVVHVDHMLSPPAYVVKMAHSGLEVSTERQCLTLVGDNVFAGEPATIPAPAAPMPPAAEGLQENHGQMSFADAVQLQQQQQQQNLWRLDTDQSPHEANSPLSVSPQPLGEPTLEDALREQEGIQRLTFADAVQLQQQQAPLAAADVMELQQQQLLQQAHLQYMEGSQTSFAAEADAYSSSAAPQVGLPAVPQHSSPTPAEAPKNHALQVLTEALDRAEIDMLSGSITGRFGTSASFLDMPPEYAGSDLNSDFPVGMAGPPDVSGDPFRNHALAAVTAALDRAEEAASVGPPKGQAKARAAPASSMPRAQGHKEFDDLPPLVFDPPKSMEPSRPSSGASTRPQHAAGRRRRREASELSTAEPSDGDVRSPHSQIAADDEHKEEPRFRPSRPRTPTEETPSQFQDAPFLRGFHEAMVSRSLRSSRCDLELPEDSQQVSAMALDTRDLREQPRQGLGQFPPFGSICHDASPAPSGTRTREESPVPSTVQDFCQWQGEAAPGDLDDHSVTSSRRLDDHGFGAHVFNNYPLGPSMPVFGPVEDREDDELEAKAMQEMGMEPCSVPFVPPRTPTQPAQAAPKGRQRPPVSARRKQVRRSSQEMLERRDFLIDCVLNDDMDGLRRRPGPARAVAARSRSASVRSVAAAATPRSATSRSVTPRCTTPRSCTTPRAGTSRCTTPRASTARAGVATPGQSRMYDYEESESRMMMSRIPTEKHLEACSQSAAHQAAAALLQHDCQRASSRGHRLVGVYGDASDKKALKRSPGGDAICVQNGGMLPQLRGRVSSKQQHEPPAGVAAAFV
eukprot:CAMPEP_0178430082 /NCGR_PEP_ID=MMETSP0689_2-20121128/31134_1 /TAXON_ID=160604 /ORGANISM="Amphidinium massartii, Strain CS-259" /LENGTH=870 /DNA_ID=CAMNT_0020051923 /DNA_START=68 /DNA_END=2677 /DNA_ORIENTATION=-